MEEKKVTKISLSTFFLILAIIAIVVMGVFIYKLNNDKTMEVEKTIKLQSEINRLNTTIRELQEKVNNTYEPISENLILELGNYMIENVEELKYNCGMKLKLNNTFEFYNKETGYSHKGKYEIKDNKLICNSDSLIWGDASYARADTENMVFTFKIINNHKLELSDIENRDSNKDKLDYKDGLTIGMAFSIK